jgi:hypothetical protein
VLGASVGSKLYITQGFVLPLHFIQRFATELVRRPIDPVTLGATKALKVLGLNPYQLAWHAQSISLTVYKTEHYLKAATSLKAGEGALCRKKLALDVFKIEHRTVLHPSCAQVFS